MKAGRIARLYRWIEYLAYGRVLERSRFVFLDRLRNARRILVLGEGDGRALTRLVEIASSAQIDVVEMSPEMIALAKARLGGRGRVRFHEQDARWANLPGGRYDGIATLFFLDCFQPDELRDVVTRLAAALTVDGVWLVTDFAIPPHGWRRWHARMLVSTMYFFFRITTGLAARELPPIAGALIDAGLRCVEREESRAGLIRAEVWSAKKS